MAAGRIRRLLKPDWIWSEIFFWGPTVYVWSDEGSEYQRFIDILNCLAEMKINSVGIVDSAETFQ